MSLAAMAFPDDVFAQTNQTAGAGSSTVESNDVTRERNFMDNPFTESSTFESPKLEHILI